MVYFNNRCKVALLTVMMVIAGQVSAEFSLASLTNVMPAMSSVSSLMPSKEQVALATFAVMYIRLMTKKSSDCNYHIEDWKKDCDELLSSFNLLDREFYKKCVKFLDKWLIGRKFSVVDVAYKAKPDEEGTVATTSDKKVKTTEFGALGIVDKYFFQQLEKLVKISDNYGKVNKVYTGLI